MVQKVNLQPEEIGTFCFCEMILMRLGVVGRLCIKGSLIDGKRRHWDDEVVNVFLVLGEVGWGEGCRNLWPLSHFVKRKIWQGSQR